MSEGSFINKLSRIFGQKNESVIKPIDPEVEKQKLLQQSAVITQEVTEKGLGTSVNPFVTEISDKGTINGTPIEEIEKRMRPGEYSIAGFLDDNETLTSVLEKDQNEVNKLGLTHKKIVEPLQLIHNDYVRLSIEDPGWKNRQEEVSFAGKKYLMSVESFRGVQISPFMDEENGHTGDWRRSTNSGTDITIQNPEDGTSINFSALLVHLIRDYGFYEGNVPYRVSPTEIAKFFEL